MTSLTPEPIFVALLAAAGTLPMFLFCFLAGILADRFDRRLYIIACQVWMMGVAATLAVLAFFGLLDHWSLLALTFCMGLGNAMNAPAWHAIVPEIVSGPQLRPAIALNSAGFNLARTVGPVVGQILLSLVGVFLLFAINAGTYIGVIFAMSSWKRSAEARAEPAPRGLRRGRPLGHRLRAQLRRAQGRFRPRPLLLHAGHRHRHAAAGDRPLRARPRRVRLRHPLRRVRRRRGGRLP